MLYVCLNTLMMNQCFGCLSNGSFGIVVDASYVQPDVSKKCENLKISRATNVLTRICPMTDKMVK